MVTEFEFIHGIKERWALNRIGDDCAVLPGDGQNDLVITADLLIEDVDFRLGWMTPELLGHKALAVSLSDIAAMGGRPAWALLSIGAPGSLWESDFLNQFYSGWHELAANWGVELVGGDVSRSPDRLVIDSIVSGHVATGRALRRSGAKPGDGIFLAGNIGGAAGGLRLLETGKRLATAFPDEEILLLNQLQPQPQRLIANLLQEQQLAHSAIDVSDGLSSDLSHLCDASGVGAEIFADKLPIEPALTLLFPPDESMDLALNGGEDFALLFTGDERKICDANIAGVRHIGHVTANTAGIRLIDASGSRLLAPLGYRHF